MLCWPALHSLHAFAVHLPSSPGTVSLNGFVRWRQGDRRCRRCSKSQYSLSHVVIHCRKRRAGCIGRHNPVLDRLAKTVPRVRATEVMANHRAPGVNGDLRPELLVVRGTGEYTKWMGPFLSKIATLRSMVAARRRATKSRSGHSPVELSGHGKRRTRGLLNTLCIFSRHPYTTRRPWSLTS